MKRKNPRGKVGTSMNIEKKKNNLAPREMYSKFKGYCGICHYTIWAGEMIYFDGQGKHLDCKRAIQDETPRILDSRYLKVVGNVNKKKMKSLLDK